MAHKVKFYIYIYIFFLYTQNLYYTYLKYTKPILSGINKHYLLLSSSVKIVKAEQQLSL